MAPGQSYSKGSLGTGGGRDAGKGVWGNRGFPRQAVESLRRKPPDCRRKTGWCEGLARKILAPLQTLFFL